MPLQDHIHLSTTIGPAPESAPNLTWVVTDRLEIPKIHMSIRESLNGRVRKHVLTDNGQVVRLTDFKYTVKVKATDGQTTEQQKNLLKSLNGEFAYLVDNYHADDGTSHTTDIRRVVVIVGEFPPIGQGLPFFLVDVECKDASLI